MEQKPGVHTFSIEMNSRSSLTHVSLSDRSTEPVLIRGELGQLENICFIDGVSLEITGKKAILRIDIDRGELERFLLQPP
jgi:hypothetical protein